MSTIGVDFKIKGANVDNKSVKLQIVSNFLNLYFFYLFFSGIQLVKRDLKQ